LYLIIKKQSEVQASWKTRCYESLRCLRAELDGLAEMAVMGTLRGHKKSGRIVSLCCGVRGLAGVRRGTGDHGVAWCGDG
jgi:hypothetical protein